MKKMYQREWHGIALETVGTVSSNDLPGPSFYSSFYDTFFKKYSKVEELDPSWVQLKMQTAGFIRQHKEFSGEIKVLSIGCGLGIAEKALIDEGFSNLEVTEISIEPLRWLLPHIARDHVHIGLFPSCLPDSRSYDFVFLSSVDYFLDQDELVGFLRAVRERLSSGGICLLMSWSFEYSISIRKVLGTFRRIAIFLLEAVNLKSKGQFWGYLRNRGDYRSAMSASGFVKVRDGLLEKKTRWDTYWVEGSRN
jgi:SAM-dependent methyltransferase